jgi:hypothetical protein
MKGEEVLMPHAALTIIKELLDKDDKEREIHQTLTARDSRRTKVQSY